MICLDFGHAGCTTDTFASSSGDWFYEFLIRVIFFPEIQIPAIGVKRNCVGSGGECGERGYEKFESR